MIKNGQLIRIRNNEILYTYYDRKMFKQSSKLLPGQLCMVLSTTTGSVLLLNSNGIVYADIDEVKWTCEELS